MTGRGYEGPRAMVGDGRFQAYQCKGFKVGEPRGCQCNWEEKNLTLRTERRWWRWVGEVSLRTV